MALTKHFFITSSGQVPLQSFKSILMYVYIDFSRFTLQVLCVHRLYRQDQVSHVCMASMSSIRFHYLSLIINTMGVQVRSRWRLRMTELDKS